jgi:hypothetical protein
MNSEKILALILHFERNDKAPIYARWRVRTHERNHITQLGLVSLLERIGGMGPTTALEWWCCG